MALLNFNYGLVKDLPSDIINGNLYITTDTQGLYVDLDNVRTHISDFIQVNSVEELEALGTYYPQVFYYVVNSNALMKYTGDAAAPWKQLNGTAADLVAEINSLKSRVTTVETSASSNASAISSLNTTVTNLSTNKADKTIVDDLTSRVGANEQSIADHATEYSNLKTALETADANLSDRITDLEELIDGVQGAMHFVGVSDTDPATGIVSINGKDNYEPINGDVVIYKDVDNNTIEYIYSNNIWVELGDVSAEAKRIGVLESEMDDVQATVAKISEIENDIVEINTAKAALEARVKANEDNIATHTTQISGLDTRLTQAEKDIVSTAADIRAELKAKAEALENAIAAETTARTTAVDNLQGQINVINSQLTWTKLTSA